MAKEKRVKRGAEPNPVKRPRYSDPGIHGDLPLAWRFSSCDCDGPFSWANLEHGAPFKQVMERLNQFEQMNWNEIIQTGSHPIEIWKLEKAAKDRLAEIKQDDLDELMSFRIKGVWRVWCIRDQNIMRVLWWDPEHAAYPSKKKNT